MPVFTPLSLSHYHPVDSGVFPPGGAPSTVSVSEPGIVDTGNVVAFDVDPGVADPSQELHSRFRGGSRYPSPGLWCARVPAGLLATPRSIVFTPEGYWFRDCIRNEAKLDRWVEIDDQLRLTLDPGVREDDREVVLVAASNVNNYWHWMLESLPRIHSAREAGVDPDLPHIMPGRLSALHEQTLRLAGLSERQVVRWDGQPTRWRCIYVPSRGLTTTNLLSVPAVDWLHSLGAAAGDNGRVTRRRLYVSRAGARHRRVVNEDELVRLLDGYGFEVVSTEQLSVDEQIRLFRDAEVIVGGHGAGLTNLAFAPATAVVCELFPEQSPVRIYWHLTACRRQGYAFCIGRSVPDPSVHQHFQDYHVKEYRLGRVLEDILVGLDERRRAGTRAAAGGSSI